MGEEKDSIDESTDEEVNEEKRKIKEMGLENMSKNSFSLLMEKKKGPEEEKPSYRGFK